MALYQYKALDKQGKRADGILDASDITSVKEQLSRRGLYVISVEKTAPEAQLPWYRRLFMRGATAKDIMLFTKQLAVLLESGVPLLQAVELLTNYFEGSFKITLIAIKDDLKEGIAFADALAKFPRIFDTIYVQLVRAGEASGKLEVVLLYLVAFQEEAEELRAKIADAMRQPIIQLVMLIGAVGVMMVFVVPKMAEAFTQAGSKLPLVTRMVQGASDFLVNYWLYLIVLGGLVVTAFSYWKNRPAGAYTFDKIKLSLPVIGEFERSNAIVQFCRTLGMLLQSGVNLADALDIVVKVVDNKVLTQQLSAARDKIIKEGKISEYLKQTGLFPPMAIYLISTGEKSGKLDEMLLTVAKNYEAELKERADTLTARLGPIMLIIMAVLIGGLVAAIMLPMQQMIEDSLAQLQ